MKKLILICGLLASGFSFGGIDTSIYSQQQRFQLEQQRQTQQNMNQLGANLGGILLNKRINQMRQLGTIDEKKAFAHKSIYSRYLIQVLNSDIAEENAQKLATLRHNAELANLKAQTDKINSETELVLLKASALPLMMETAPSSKEERVYIEHIEDNLYKTDDSRLIKTRSCYEYVYSEKALIMQNKLIFKNSKTCDIEKIINL